LRAPSWRTRQSLSGGDGHPPTEGPSRPCPSC
jgi:hypothetical protein